MLAAAAIVIGGTYAFFSDTETASGNLFSTGTIDIAVDDQNPWEGQYEISDIKPGETGTVTFDVENVGSNPVKVFKSLKNIVANGGEEPYECDQYFTSSEPECVAEAGTPKNEIQRKILYGLSVEVYDAQSNKIWWQTIYSDSDNKKLNQVYGLNGGKYVELGMVPVGGYMKVVQTYHLMENTGNEYQGDSIVFDIEIKGEQLQQNEGAIVTLENKNTSTWDIILGDGIQGTLVYNTKGATFDYDFVASGLDAGTNYSLIYYPDPWANPKTVILIGSAMLTDGSGEISSLGNSVELGTDLPAVGDDNYPDGAKIWLVPSSSLSGSTLSWTPNKFLYETSLMTYDDTDL